VVPGPGKRDVCVRRFDLDMLPRSMMSRIFEAFAECLRSRNSRIGRMEFEGVECDNECAEK